VVAEDAGPDNPPRVAPLTVPKAPKMRQDMPRIFGADYWYLPYAVTNNEQGVAMVNAIGERLKQGKELKPILDVPQGKGAGGSDKLYRVHTGVTQRFIRNVNNPKPVSTADIPVVVGDPRALGAGNVLYMDGHLAFRDYPGEFPMTRDFIEGLASLDQHFERAVPGKEQAAAEGETKGG